MKNKLIAVMVALSAINLNAQNTSLDYHYALKAGNLSAYEESSHTGSGGGFQNVKQFNDRQTILLHPYISFQWKAGQNFQEVSLNDLKWDHMETISETRPDSSSLVIRVGRQDVRESAISVSYEYTFVFLKKKDRRLVPSLGLAANPYYRQYHFSPDLPFAYAQTEIHAGIRMLLTPGVSWFFRDRLFMDLKAPLYLSNAEFLSTDNQDPAIPKDQRSINSFDMNVFPHAFSVKVGLGIKL